MLNVERRPDLTKRIRLAITIPWVYQNVFDCYFRLGGGVV
jgi:hypothetical protein